jgi:hypothetical protein
VPASLVIQPKPGALARYRTHSSAYRVRVVLTARYTTTKTTINASVRVQDIGTQARKPSLREEALQNEGASGAGSGWGRLEGMLYG